MKIMNIQNYKNSPSFGLKIVENDSYKKLLNFYSQRGAKKEITDVFENIKKLDNDDVSLELSNFKSEYAEFMGITIPVCNVRIFGKMKEQASGRKFPVDTSTEKHIACDLIMPRQIKNILKEMHEKIDKLN